MNFGECLAYWYFRLNGFFPLVNFVLHRPDEGKRHNADADLLAVRFPHASETIGGRPVEWDNERFREWGLLHHEVPAGIVCEVKTGGYKEADVQSAFGRRRLRYAIHRMGIVPPEEVEQVCEELRNRRTVERPSATFAKVLIASHIPRWASRRPWHSLELRPSVDFIKDRMRQFRDPKSKSRMFFPSDLIQYFAWEAGFVPSHDA